MTFAITPTKIANNNTPNGTAMATVPEWIGLPAADAVDPAAVVVPDWVAFCDVESEAATIMKGLL